jgi:hypothetical protein
MLTADTSITLYAVVLVAASLRITERRCIVIKRSLYRTVCCLSLSAAMKLR